MKEFTIDVSPDGKQVVVEGHGFVGAECEQLGKDMLEALGKVVETEKKPEYRMQRALPRGKTVTR